MSADFFGVNRTTLTKNRRQRSVLRHLIFGFSVDFLLSISWFLQGLRDFFVIPKNPPFYSKFLVYLFVMSKSRNCAKLAWFRLFLSVLLPFLGFSFNWPHEQPQKQIGCGTISHKKPSDHLLWFPAKLTRYFPSCQRFFAPRVSTPHELTNISFGIVLVCFFYLNNRIFGSFRGFRRVKRFPTFMTDSILLGPMSHFGIQHRTVSASLSWLFLWFLVAVSFLGEEINVCYHYFGCQSIQTKHFIPTLQ